MNCARTALCDAATELRSSQADDVPQHPQQWHVWSNVDRAILSIDIERDHLSILVGKSTVGNLLQTADVWTSVPAAME
jgi:hypothetical protein